MTTSGNLTASGQTTPRYPFAVPESKPDPRVFSGEGQAFLVGDTIFLRGLEEEDARRASGWRDSPYPINAERAGELIKERVEKPEPGRRFWVACRRGDGLPVGSVQMDRWPGNNLQMDLALYANPAFPGSDQVKAELLRIVTEWGFGEAEIPRFRVEIADDETAVLSTARALGMEHSATWRERRWRDGAWQDIHAYDLWNPRWRAGVGIRGPGIEYAMPIDDPSRWRPRQYPTYGTVVGDPPANAVMVGPRVYLRPIEMNDAVEMVATDRREPETFMDEGRYPRSVLEARNWIRELHKPELQEWVRFAVCRREDGQLIGINGIAEIDRINMTAETESWFFAGVGRDQGYGTEAKHLLLAYAFECLGLHSVHSWVWGPNGRSAAALIKQGYRECGRTWGMGTKHGEYTHARTFDLLASEWREMTTRSAMASNGHAAHAD